VLAASLIANSRVLLLHFPGKVITFAMCNDITPSNINLFRFMTHIKFTRVLFPCVAILLATLAACSGDSKGDYVNVDSGYNTTKIYENPANTYSGGISFSTSGAWTASLASDNGGKPSEWLTVSPMSGDKAGKYNLDLTFTANNSTIDRNAALKVNCGEASRTFYIVQRCKGSDSSVNDRTLEGFSDIVKTFTLTNAHPADSVQFLISKSRVCITGYVINNSEVLVNYTNKSFDYDQEWTNSLVIRPNAAESDTVRYTYSTYTYYILNIKMKFELVSELQDATSKAIISLSFNGKVL
jgi:hypothetical protein